MIKSESKNLYIIRKVIIANKNIKKGELFTKDNIAFKRAGRGISPIEIENVLGRVAKKNFSLVYSVHCAGIEFHKFKSLVKG